MQYLIDIYHKLNHEIIMLMIMILSLIPVVLFIKKLIFTPIRNYLSQHHYEDYERVLKNHSIFRYSLHSILGLYFIFWGNILRPTSFNTHILMGIKDTVIILYTSISFTLLSLAIVDAITELYQGKIKILTKNAPLSLYFQILKIIILSTAAIITLSYLLDISLSKFFTSLGAVAALLTFVFKDTMIGLITSIQLTSQGIIGIGDWIRVGDIEGVIEKITISVVTVRNFDQSISTIPTSSILTSNVINYTGLIEAGARRIERTININIGTISFCDATILEGLKKSPYLAKDMVDRIIPDKEDKNLTNIKLFKLYIKEYLKSNSVVHKEEFTFLVKQLDPTNYGLPIKISLFVKEISGEAYEDIKDSIFEHLISVLPEFKLKIFQNIGI